MVELVCSLHTSHENWEDGDTVMRIQLFSYVLSLCSQDNRNCQYVFHLSVPYHNVHSSNSLPQGTAEVAALAELVPRAGRPEVRAGVR